MCRKAQLYLLDEPIAGVDPAARDFILDTILNNYNEEGTVIISTHLIADIEKIMDEVIFIKEGNIVTYKSAYELREESGKSSMPCSVRYFIQMYTEEGTKHVRQIN